MTRLHSTLIHGIAPVSVAGCLVLGLAIFPSSAGAAQLAEGAPRDSLKLEVLVSGLEQATDIAPLSDGRAVVTQRNGDIVVVKSDGTKTLAGHINVKVSLPEMGLLGIVSDPNFASNRYLYVYASVASGSDADRNKVLRIVLGSDNKLVGEPTPIIDKGLIGRNNHNGGGLQIHDNQLYVSVGDSGYNPVDSPYIPRNRLPSCLNSANGKILRVNLDGSVPEDNPLRGMSQVTGCDGWDQPFKMAAPDPRIFAWGFRNPFRFWVDPRSGLMWIGDVGEVTREEISVGKGGQHFGYPFVEGTRVYSRDEQPLQPENGCKGMTPAKDCTPPQYDYPHAGASNCVIGGLILDGCGWPEPWPSRYVFADNGSGNVWTLDVNEERSGAVASSRKNFATASGPASFRMGPDGSLYIVEVAGGAVQKITPKDPTTTTCPPPSGNGGTGGTTGAGGSGTGGSGNGESGGTNSGRGGSSNESGGTTSSGGSTSKGGSGGVPSSGGSRASAGSVGNDNENSAAQDDGGCSCRVSPRAAFGIWGSLSGLVIFAASLRRARRARGRRDLNNL